MEEEGGRAPPPTVRGKEAGSPRSLTHHHEPSPPGVVFVWMDFWQEPHASSASPAPPPERRAELDRALQALQHAKHEWAALGLAEKVALLEEVTRRLGAHAEKWVQAAVRAKGIPPQSPWVGEEWVSGPWVVATSLNGYRHTLDALENGRLTSFKRMRTTTTGRLAVQVFPATMAERLVLNGITAEVWMQPGVTAANLADNMASFYKEARPAGRVAVVLGAGNITAIAPLDAMHRLFVRGHVVLLKCSPLLDYLGPVIEDVFEPFVRRGFLRIAYGGADVGSYLARHADTDELHMTGSFRTYDALLYGDGPEGAARKQRGERILQKPMTAELGGAGPVIVVPGPWSDADIRYQAENIVTMKMQNVGFNCVAAQVLVLPREWPLRERFMAAIRAVMRSLPERRAYYPEAAAHWTAVRARHDRIETFAGEVPAALLPDLDAENEAESAFDTEFFGPVLAETELPGRDAATFFKNAVAFCNERLLGNLGANIVIHPKTMRALGNGFEAGLADLRYGAIGVNIWDAAAFLFAEGTWGAYPEPDRKPRGSGNGVVRNAFLFDRPERTVSYGSFYPFPRSVAHGMLALLPKPPWFVTNKTAAETARQIVDFTVNPRYRDLPRLFAKALRG